MVALSTADRRPATVTAAIVLLVVSVAAIFIPAAGGEEISYFILSLRISAQRSPRGARTPPARRGGRRRRDVVAVRRSSPEIPPIRGIGV